MDSEEILERARAEKIITQEQFEKIAALSAETQETEIAAVEEQASVQREEDEPFQLFNGFSEIAIMVGLFILYSGAVGVLGFFEGTLQSFLGYGDPSYDRGFSFAMLVSGALVCVILFGVGYFYSQVKRLVGPSNLLVVLLAVTAFFTLYGYSGNFSASLDPDKKFLWQIVFAASLSSALMFACWWVCRIPLTMFFIAAFLLSVFISAMSLAVSDLYDYSYYGDGFYDDELRHGWNVRYYLGVFAPAIISGIVAFVLAMRFDLRDRERKKRDNSNAFWLHAFSSIAFIHPIAVDLSASPAAAKTFLLVIFVILIAMVALIVDRRVFLLSCIGYVVGTLVYYEVFGVAGTLLFIGLVLVLMNTWWRNLRNAFMQAIPNFPGKSCLHPWQEQS